MKIVAPIILMLLVLVSCSEKTSKTSAKLKLNLGATTNGGTTISSGGVMLFGKSSTGEQFGRVVTGAEQELDLTNGDWTFYALMWPSNTGYKMAEAPYCGKSSAKLSGTAVTVSFNLTNQNCADNDFSGGNHYVDSYSKVRFPKLFLDECDELVAGVQCTRYNRGSALSYRMDLRSYTKSAAGVVTFGPDSIKSKCVAATGGTTMYADGMQIDFPSSNSAMPFIISTEMFLGTSDCATSAGIDPKGVYTHSFLNGLVSSVPGVNTAISSTGYMCPNWNAGSQAACEVNNGYWASTFCQMNPDMQSFIDPTTCTSPNTTPVRMIKQLVTIPKSFLCGNLSTGVTGADVFSGGNGQLARPYKICNEWQLNQIGESNTLSTSSFKLMNDLDMNKADFNIATIPPCAGKNGSVVKKHHNLNPLDQITSGGCDSSSVVNGNSYTGIFNGNNKTISNGRIYADVDGLGFVRFLGSGGFILDLNFKNLEVEGNSSVGLIAGQTTGTSTRIQNVKINGGNVEAETSFVGGAAGKILSSSTIANVLVQDVRVHGQEKVGGLAGLSNGSISASMFRGEIEQHSNVDSQVGGLVGLAESSSNLSTSFSEGRILSYAKHTGGIAGHNMGVINNAYSTMFIHSRYNSSSAFVGGIAGSNQSGSIQDVYFDGVLKYDGGGSTPVTDAITAFAGSLESNCVSTTSSMSVSNCLTYPTLRNGTYFSGNSNWVLPASDVQPRLAWELASRPCTQAINTQDITSQISSGRGSQTNPLVICSPNQLKQFGLSGFDKYAVLLEDINLSTWVEADLIPANSKTFDGKNHNIIGLSINAYSAAGALFKYNTGKIINLNMYGNTLNQNVDGVSGILNGSNSGQISGIKMAGNKLSGYTGAGLISGQQIQSGTINDVVIVDSKIDGISVVGGIVGSNEGSITRSSVNVSMTQKSGNTLYTKFGGAVGLNGQYGKLDQISFGGNIDFSEPSTNASFFAGGLIGYNLGALTNSLVKNYSQINVKNASMVGGLVGYQGAGSTLKTSFTTGKLIYTPGQVPGGSYFNQLIGFNASTAEVLSYFLEKKAGGLLGSQTVDSACTSGNASFTSAMPTYLIFPTPIANLMSPNNVYTSGDSLSTLFPVTLSSSYIVPYTGSCVAGDIFSFYESYEPSTIGKKTIAEFALLSTFNGYDMAYDDPTSTASLNYDRLIDYHVSRMNGVAPTLIPPIWVFEQNGYPRLLQVND